MGAIVRRLYAWKAGGIMMSSAIAEDRLARFLRY
jgi:hypothetical protein